MQDFCLVSHPPGCSVSPDGGGSCRGTGESWGDCSESALSVVDL